MAARTTDGTADSWRTLRMAVGLMALVLVLIAGLLAATVYTDRRETRMRAFERAYAGAQVVAMNARWINELAIQSLRRIDDSVGPMPPDFSGRIGRNVSDAVAGLPGNSKAYVVDARGNTLYTTDPQVAPINITDREYFAAVRDGDDFHVTPLLISRLNGEQIFVFSRRLERDGVFAGAAILSFDVALLRDIWSSLQLDENSTVSLIRKDGMLVARYPLADRALDMRNYELFTEHLRWSPSGTYPAISPLDGVERYVGYVTVPETEFIAVSTISYSAALGSFWRNVHTLALLTTPVLLALVAAFAWIALLLRRDAARQKALSDALATNKLLFRDTHHRVKNNLQSIVSLVRMHPLPAEAKAELQSRIGAMSAVHEHMYRLDQYAEVVASQFIPALVEPLVKAFDNEVKLETDIDDVTVDRDFATPLALLVNEVVTNALKYAFPDGREGRIKVTLRQTAKDRARLEIRDNGVGTDPSSGAGMGMRIIRGMAAQMNGTYTIENDNGTVFTADLDIRIPPGAEAARPAA